MQGHETALLRVRENAAHDPWGADAWGVRVWAAVGAAFVAPVVVLYTLLSIFAG